MYSLFFDIVRHACSWIVFFDSHDAHSLYFVCIVCFMDMYAFYRGENGNFRIARNACIYNSTSVAVTA